MRHSPHKLISGRDESRTKVPSCNSARAQGSKEDGTILFRGVLQPASGYGHTSALESVMFFSSSPLQRVQSHLQSGAFRHQTCLEIAPERD